MYAHWKFGRPRPLHSDPGGYWRHWGVVLLAVAAFFSASWLPGIGHPGWQHAYSVNTVSWRDGPWFSFAIWLVVNLPFLFSTLYYLSNGYRSDEMRLTTTTKHCLQMTIGGMIVCTIFAIGWLLTALLVY